LHDLLRLNCEIVQVHNGAYLFKVQKSDFDVQKHMMFINPADNMCHLSPGP